MLSCSALLRHRVLLFFIRLKVMGGEAAKQPQSRLPSVTAMTATCSLQRPSYLIFRTLQPRHAICACPLAAFLAYMNKVLAIPRAHCTCMRNQPSVDAVAAASQERIERMAPSARPCHDGAGAYDRCSYVEVHAFAAHR